jgi:multidrug efflux pump subunit AcrA (membrane-fusion protein)
MAKQSKSGLFLKALVWLVILGAAGAAVAWYATREPVFEVTVQKLARGPVEETIAAISSGAVMPESKAMVAAATIGVIEQVHVEEGQAVNEGDLLVELQHAELDAQVEVAKANLAAARIRLEQAKLGVEVSREMSQSRVGQAGAQKDAAQADYARMKALLAQQAISASEMDKMTLALRVAQEAQNAANTGVKESVVREQDVASADALIEQLEAGIKAAEAARDRSFVKRAHQWRRCEDQPAQGRGHRHGRAPPPPRRQQLGKAMSRRPLTRQTPRRSRLGQEARIELDAYRRPRVQGRGDLRLPGHHPEHGPQPHFHRARQDPRGSREVRRRHVRVGHHHRAAQGRRPQGPGGVARARGVLLRRREWPRHKREVTLGIGNWEYKEVLTGLRGGEDHHHLR